MPIATQPVESAKRFLISKVLEQASRDGLSLSGAEKKMLAFDEGAGQVEGAEEFERECDSDEYEAKIAKLLRRAYARDKKFGDLTQWNESLRALRDQDFYLLVMVDQAGIHVPRSALEFLRSFLTLEAIVTFGGTAVILAAGITLLFTPYGARFVHTDAARWATFLICIGLVGVIALIWERYFR